MYCPLCRERSARRFCPAKGAQICAICCGTKRQVEIACPPDCPFLATARSHPPATVKRQHQRDAVWLALMLEGLDERQHQLCWLLLQPVLAPVDPFLSPADADVAEAAAAVAATYETAAKGVIYEHRAGSLVGQRLSAELRRLLGEAGVEKSRALERDAVTVLRRIEGAARAAGRQPAAGPRTLVEALSRVAKEAALDARAEERRRGGLEAPPAPDGLILP
jgi:hypothetical protein